MLAALAWPNEASCNNKQKDKQDTGKPVSSHLSSSPTQEKNNIPPPHSQM